MKIVVIGSGIVGSSVAYECAKAGAQVTVLEAGRVAGATSSISFAWTNATTKFPRPYYDLNVAGMRAHLELRRDFGITPWFSQTGSVEWRNQPEDQAAYLENFRLMKEWGYGVDWISRATLAEMEPDVNVAAIGDGPISYFPEEGWIDPALYCAWLLRAAKARWGAEVHEHARVNAIETVGGKVHRVRTVDGTSFAADRVINCTGGWADTVLGDAHGIPLASNIGVLGFTPPVALTLRSQLHADDMDIRPDGAGRIMIHKISVDSTMKAPDPLATDSVQAQALMAAVREVLPALEAVELEAVRTTVRPFPADGYTCAGAMPDISGHYMAVTHSGVTIAPYLGRAVADEVVRGEIHADLETFRPERFFQHRSAQAETTEA
ncbi:FAD-binding oxidoreductase [Paracoccus pantotrophus]|uniref:NAD(P)/FAD-dependent oxidoreductase n=1 Tax=Paracoccus pantotrophus TaxID=82367 RepID=UPI000E08F6EF|nr:FAD-binding oxidoreductase [Paracoccus pantotrophus]RDD95290.1 FAD-binding oxidoreductase [Paracoccus pantotrophus]WGR64181.1 FAD-binding oxidoreductase [Paracoccus pantotrophus]